MCRFVMYLGPSIRLSSLVTEPMHSLIHQSTHALEREEPLNGDGFGLAWFLESDEAPALFRSVTPAWSNQNLTHIARAVKSRCVLAHVRAATSGAGINENNCHPFCDGHFAFMHNGDVGGFDKLRRALLSSLSDRAFATIAGTTDSEHLFALFLDAIGQRRGVAAMAEAIRTTLGRILALREEFAPAEHCYINLAVADGVEAVACRYSTDPNYCDSLYLSVGRRYLCRDGVCMMVDPEPGQAAVVISSERLSEDSAWQAIPPNHLVIIQPGLEVALEPLALGLRDAPRRPDTFAG